MFIYLCVAVWFSVLRCCCFLFLFFFSPFGNSSGRDESGLFLFREPLQLRYSAHSLFSSFVRFFPRRIAPYAKYPNTTTPTNTLLIIVGPRCRCITCLSLNHVKHNDRMHQQILSLLSKNLSPTRKTIETYNAHCSSLGYCLAFSIPSHFSVHYIFYTLQTSLISISAFPYPPFFYNNTFFTSTISSDCVGGLKSLVHLQ